MQEQGVLQRLKTKWWKEMHGGGKCLVSPSLLKNIYLSPNNYFFTTSYFSHSE